NFPLAAVPRNVTAAMQTTAMSATSRIYSTSEAPSSSRSHWTILPTMPDQFMTYLLLRNVSCYSPTNRIVDNHTSDSLFGHRARRFLLFVFGNSFRPDV